MEIEIAIAVFTLILLTLLASVDMAFSQLSDVSLRRLFTESEETKKPRSVEFLHEILENRPRFRFALSSAIQILLIVFSVLVVLIVYNFTVLPREMLAYSLLVGLSFSVIFRQIIPRFLTWKNPEGKLMALIPLVRPLYNILPFIADPFEPSFRGKESSKLENSLLQEIHESKLDENNAEDIQALIEIGEAEGILEENQRELIETMVAFNETKAGEIMTPRPEIVALPLDSSVKDARDLIIEEKFSRIPVYREKIDNIVGVIYVRDLLNAWAEGNEDKKIGTFMRPPFFVPETKSASDLLNTLQTNHNQIAIIIDEYGGVAGLVTVEDIIEEIVGEIEDEDLDEEIVEIIEGDAGYYDILGSTEIDNIERLFDIEIEDEDFTTLAGMVISEAGYVPKTGEKLTLRGLEVEILQADEKKINLLRLHKLTTEEEIIQEISA